MKKNSLLVLIASFLMLFCSTTLTAQSLTQTIRGTVQDADTELRLEGATVKIPALKMGALTKENGTFKIEKVPLGRHDVVISFLGYEPQTLPNVLVGSAKEIVLTLNLVESVVEMDVVLIEGEEDKVASVNELSLVSTRAFSVEETKRYAGSIDDPSRMALSFAGVSSGEDEENNEIVIRGNSPRFMLWRIEGIEVPSPNHFTDQGASSGAVSILSSNMLANSDFSTGAFQAEYGNALSGVFDINLRKGNNEKREYAFQFGVLGVDFAAEGPFKKGYDGSYLINYRYSTLSLMNQLGIGIVGDAVPVFQDLSFKLHLPTEKLGTFSVFGIGGNSFIEDQGEGYLPDSTIGTVWKDRFASNMAMTGVGHKLLIGNKTVLNSSVAFTGSQINYKNNELDSLLNFFEDDNEDFQNYAIKAQATVTHKVNAKHLFKSGVYYTRQIYDLNSSYYDFERSVWIEDLKEKGNADTWQGFATWRYRMNDKLTFNTGLHAMHFGVTNEISIEPRLSLKYQLSSKDYFSAGFGIHSRREDLALYFAKDIDLSGKVLQPNTNLGLAKARHYVVGYDRMFGKNLHFRAEVYYQDLYNVPVYNDSSISFSVINTTSGYTSDPFVNKGTGTNYGLEVTLEKFFSQNYFFLITGSLYESKYTSIDGETYNTLYNGNYITNFMFGKEFVVGKSRNNRINLSARMILSGGKRYTPVDLEASRDAGYTIGVKGRNFEERTPTYWRPDLSVGYTMNRKKTSHTIKLEVQNVINRTNVLRRYYSSRTGNIEDDVRGSIIPVFSYKLNF